MVKTIKAPGKMVERITPPKPPQNKKQKVSSILFLTVAENY